MSHRSQEDLVYIDAGRLSDCVRNRLRHRIDRKSAIDPGFGRLLDFRVQDFVKQLSGNRPRRDRRIKQGHYKFPKLKMLPSEYFQRQMGATFMNEPHGLKVATDYFGPDAFYWSTDFPHPATCWPHSRETIEHQFTEAGLSAEDRYKIVCGNGMRTFGFE